MSYPVPRSLPLSLTPLPLETVLLGSGNSNKVSKAYKLWYDRLTLAVRLAMPPSHPYSVIHTENLVGLFTCIFVRNSERDSLKDIAITTVKRGMGGHYGNKVRFQSLVICLFKSLKSLKSFKSCRERSFLASSSTIPRCASSIATLPPVSIPRWPEITILLRSWTRKWSFPRRKWTS